MERLSVTIITCNEEKNIRDCLESVKWADEIIVIDSNSKDKTVEICREYTEKVFVEEWHGFGLQKNLCIEKADCKWILNLDADERIPSGLKEEIVNLLKRNDTYDGYYIARKNFFGKKWIKYGGWYPDYNLRLFKKEKGRFNERGVHEKVELKGKAGYLENHLEHYTYRDTGDFFERMNRYSTLSAKELYKGQKRASLFNIALRPPFTFFKMYILKRGFLDGYSGFLLALLYSFYTFGKYVKLKEFSDHA
jgi:glycosyltransferase involved in cell wall biosynthesis